MGRHFIDIHTSIISRALPMYTSLMPSKILCDLWLRGSNLLPYNLRSGVRTPTIDITVATAIAVVRSPTMHADSGEYIIYHVHDCCLGKGRKRNIYTALYGQVDRK